MKEFDIMNEINLIFDKSITELHGNDYGQDIYCKQLEGNINWNDKNIIIFPNTIEGVAISFAQGLSKSIFEIISKSEFLERFDIQAKSEYLENRIKKNILY